MFVHGHVHHEPGMNWIHRSKRHCCIVNPGGALQESKRRVMSRGGKYAKVKIECKNGVWKVVNVQHIIDY